MSDDVRPTHLFAVRIWEQAIENGRTEWRGRVQYVPTGEVHYFRQWDDLVAILKRLLPGPDAGATADDGQRNRQQ